MDDILLCKYFNNQATAEEIEQIEQWIKSDESHCKEFEAAHTMFNMMVLQQIRRTAAEAKPAAAQEVRKPAAAAAAEPAPRKGMLRQTMRAAMRLGMALLFAAVIGVAGTFFGRRSALNDICAKVQSVEVPAGKCVAITLPDGTSVYLNGGSRIEYPPVFAADCRRVKLSGEALFGVVHDAAHPFIVETFASEVEVLGTTFNVYTDEEHSRFSTTLAEGKVKVTLLDGGDQIILRPDEMALLENGRLMKRTVKADDIICWTEGYINISNVSFDELMSRFERAFDVDILISRPTMPSIGYVSGKIRISEGIGFAMRLLQSASDFDFEIDTATNTVIIK